MGEPLRVLLVSPQSTGGIGRHVAMLAAGLRERGHEVTVTAPAETLHRLDLPPQVARETLRLSRLRPQARAHDLVHAHGVRMGAAAAVLGGAPVVATWHNAPLGSARRRAVHAALERLSARGSAVVLGASPDLVVRARAAGARHARLCPVAAPVRTVVRRRPDPDGPPVVLCVARLHPQKRLDVLVDALRGWTGVRVLVAGDGPLRAELQQHAAAAGAPVELLGARDDVDELLGGATAFVLPSDWEARPLVVQEALAAGVPVVATAVGGVPDLVGDAAVLVPPGDPDALGSALRRVLDDDALQARLSEAGRRQAASWPDAAAMLDAVESAYRIAVSPSG